MSTSDTRPLYQQIKEDITLQIEGKLLLPGDRVPTELQLMERYNVSRITAAKALNELKTEGLIVRYPNKGSFVAGSTQAESFSTGVPSVQPAEKLSALREIACIIPSIEDFFSTTLTAGVHSALPEDRYVCNIMPSRNPSTENYLLQKCIDQQIAGIILFPQDQPFFSNQLLYLLFQKYPLVLVDRPLPRLDTSYVISDNNAGGSICLTHLHSLGHQRFCFVSSTTLSTFSIKGRARGIQEAAARLNLPEDSVTIVENLNKHQPFEFHKAEFLRLIQEEQITAFIAAESSTSTYLYEMFTAFGVRIPQDISLICFDKPFCNTKESAFFAHIDQSEFLIGREAGILLKKRIEGNDMEVHHRIIPPKLVEGASVMRCHV